jgi:hypothetical protein
MTSPERDVAAIAGVVVVDLTECRVRDRIDGMRIYA